MTNEPENNGTPATPKETNAAGKCRLQRMDGRQEESAESGVPFGDTDLGGALGCATIILAIGIAIAIYAWAAR